MNLIASKTKKMVLAALFVSLDIVLTRFFSFDFMGIERITLNFVPQALCGYFLGPVWCMLSLVSSDFLGMMLFPTGGAYFFGFTVTAALKGLAYGYVLHNKPVSFKRIIISQLISLLVLGVFLNSLWLSMIIPGKGFWMIAKVKILFKFVTVPATSYILLLIMRAIGKAFSKNAAAKA
ncbi:MAG TPA: folate transporter [Ruminococcaceae bacterium]|nr:folate transporter [Oscillospiraceae bacterium]